MSRATTAIYTEEAPEAIGPYSQAIQMDQVVYLSGQIPLHPITLEPINGSIELQAERAFENLQAVCEEAGGRLGDIVKLTIYLTDMQYFARINEVMARFFQPPYPARAAIGVVALPKGVEVEVEAVMVITR